MAAVQQKKQAKGQKIGRHSRAASNSQQANRTARNKRVNLEKNPGSAQGIPEYGRKHFRTLEDPQRPSRMPSVHALNDTKLARVAAQRAANAVDVNSGWTLTMAEKVLKAARPKATMHDWKLAQAFQRKQAMAKQKRVVV